MVKGKVVATSTHAIEQVKSQDGGQYTVYIKNGRINGLARVIAGEPEQLLYIVAD